MTNRHTPGPWTIDHERIGPPGDPVALLCDVGAPDSGTVIDWPRDSEHAGHADGENEANARLIAAAPTMLAALRDMCMSINYEHDGQLNDLYGVSKGLAAIALATAGGDARPDWAAFDTMDAYAARDAAAVGTEAQR